MTITQYKKVTKTTKLLTVIIHVNINTLIYMMKYDNGSKTNPFAELNDTEY